MARAKKNEIVVKEEKENIDLTSIKEELTSYVDKEIKKNFDDEVKKVYNKLLRDKGRKVFVRNIIILVLLCIIGFLVYLLYDVGYFDKYFNKPVDNTPTNNEVVNDEPNNVVEEPIGPTLEDLKKEFGYLLNNVIIDDESVYVGDYYRGNLNNELKNYLVTNLLDYSNLPVDDECNIIDGELFKEYYSKLFEGEYSKNSFDFNGDRVRYINKLESFITSSVLVKRETKIKREIIDIQVSENSIMITTVEGIVSDNKLYNVVSKNEVKKYKNDSLVNYKDDLTTITYTFKENLLDSIK